MNEQKMNYIARLEQEVEKRYGKDAAKPFFPKEIDNINDQLNILNNRKKRENRKINIENKICKKCQKLSFKLEDSIYLTKYNYCEKCYILYIE